MRATLLITAAATCLGLAGIIFAQAPATLVMNASNARYYLLQPFYEADASRRLAIQHLGLEVIQVENSYLVNSLLDGYPAALAGIRRGDKILSLNGKTIDSELFIDSGIYLSSESGSQSTQTAFIQLQRDSQTLEFALQPVFENLFDSRRTAALSSIQQFSAGNKTIAYFHPWALSRNLSDLLSFTRVIASIAQSDGLILDLRDSFGFLSNQHVAAFLPDDSTLAGVSGPGNLHTRFDFKEQSLLSRHYGKPVAILVNTGTSGGAELLAYFLAQLDRITTIGEETAGELGVFELRGTEAEQALHYIPPTDTSINGESLTELRVKPELPVDYPPTLSMRSDPQFQAAFNLLLGLI